MKSISKNFRNAAVATVFGGSLLVTAGMGVAGAEPMPPSAPGSDGLVNVVVGGAPLLDSVPNAQAVQAVIERCALPEPAVSAMVAQVDAAGVSQTACAGQPSGDVVVAQNLPAGEAPSPVVPETSAEIGAEPAAEPESPVEPIPDSLPDEPNNIPGFN